MHFKKQWVKNVKYFFCWQGINLISVLLLLCSNLLADSNTSFPFFQPCAAYLLLFMIYIALFYKKYNSVKPINKVWKYTLLAIADYTGNVLIYLAFNFTTTTSVFLLQVFIPIFSIFLHWRRKSYKHAWYHYVAVLISIISAAFLFVDDTTLYTPTEVTKVLSQLATLKVQNIGDRILGDGMVVVACFAKAFESLQEYVIILENHDYTEMLAFLGLFGAILSFLVGVSVDHKVLTDIIANGRSKEIYIVFAVATVSLVLIYALTFLLMNKSGDVVMNFSSLMLLVWGLLLHISLSDLRLQILRIVAFFFSIVGVVLYHFLPHAPPLTVNNKIVLEK